MIQTGNGYDRLAKIMIVHFWTLYFTVVLLSNSINAINEFSAGSLKWEFSSGNLGLIKTFTSVYDSPLWFPYFLFGGVLSWQGIGVFLFWKAVYLSYIKSKEAERYVYLSFMTTCLLWAGFILADEVFLIYKAGQIQSVHVNLFAAEMICFLFIRLIK